MAYSITRRWRNWWPELGAALLAVVAIAMQDWLQMVGGRSGVVLGWLLFSVFVFLSAFGLRRRLPHVPLGHATTWRKLHTLLGWLAVVLFLMHAGVLPPAGVLDALLWWLFVGASVVGIIGSVLNRTLPRDLERGGQRAMLERLPGVAWAIAERARVLVKALPDDPMSVPAVRFYRVRLQPALTAPLRLRRALHARRRERLLVELQAVQENVDGDTFGVLEEFRELLRDRAGVERQYQALSMLRLWVELHLALAVSALVFVVVHVLTRYGFRV